MTNMSVNKRKCLSLYDKAEIIRELEHGGKNVSVYKELNLSSTVLNFWKNNEKILCSRRMSLQTNK